MKRIRARLTLANVVAFLALFVALGGASYAATQLPKNSVGAKQLKNGAVTSAKLRAKAVTTAKLANGAVTGAKVNAGTLGMVPSADHANNATTANSAATAGDANTLQGKTASAFVQGQAQILGNTVQLDLGRREVPILTLPGFGPLTAYCETGKEHPIGGFEILNTSGGLLSLTLQFPEGGTDSGLLAPGADSLVGGYESRGAWTWTFATLSRPSRIVTLNLAFNGDATPTACALTAQAVISG